MDKKAVGIVFLPEGELKFPLRGELGIKRFKKLFNKKPVMIMQGSEIIFMSLGGI